MKKGNTGIGPGATLSRIVRLLGGEDRGSPLSPETVYELLYGDNPGWIVLRIADGTLILLAPDGTALEVR